MNKTFFSNSTICLLLIAAFPLSSCIKGNPFKLEEIVLDLKNGQADLKDQCVIEQINFLGVPFPFIATQYNITYNSRRDPVTMTPNFISTGFPVKEFFYDKKGRLIHFAGVFSDFPIDSGFMFWHNYFYDAKDRIIGDSQYISGFVARLGSSAVREFTVFTYDNLNRVIKSSLTENFRIDQPPIVNTYVYDAAGNLGTAPDGYDNNANVLLTNKIWRFLALDYSLNNTVKADAYNGHRFPLLYSNNTGGEEMLFFESNIEGVQGISFQYDCQDNLPPAFGKK